MAQITINEGLAWLKTLKRNSLVAASLLVLDTGYGIYVTLMNQMTIICQDAKVPDDQLSF